MFQIGSRTVIPKVRLDRAVRPSDLPFTRWLVQPAAVLKICATAARNAQAATKNDNWLLKE